MSDVVDTDELRQQFVEAELLGVVALIDFLAAEEASGRTVVEIGTPHINNTEKPFEDLNDAEVMRLPNFFLGKKGKKSPIVELSEIAPLLLDHKDDKGVRLVDQVCLDLTQADPKKWKRIARRSYIAK